MDQILKEIYWDVWKVVVVFNLTGYNVLENYSNQNGYWYTGWQMRRVENTGRNIISDTNLS